jgi:phage terminase small subunit
MSELAKPEPIDEEAALLSELNFQQEAFALAYVANGRNATRAAAEAGYGSPEQTGYRLTRTPWVKAYIEFKIAQQRDTRDAMLRAKHLTPDRILEELAAVAGFDLGDMIVQGPDGPRLDATRLKGEHTRVLQSIETERGSGKTKVKVKAYDKLKALDMLMDHLGMKRTQTQVNVQVNVGFAERMAARRARALEDR